MLVGKERKENYISVLTCKKGIDVPMYAPPFRAPIGFMDSFEKGPEGGGKDGFGVLWNITPDGPIPSSKEFLLDDIANWEKVVHFPDIDSIDWKAKSEKDLERWDRDSQCIEYGMGNSHFERLMALMGFENGLCALITDPENVKLYMEAYTEYRIKLVKKVVEYYHPDVICNYDDVATIKGPFMSREIYQELISPYHKAFNDVVKSYGVIPMQHCCGKAEELIEDFILEGAQSWTSVQPENDIVGLLQKYGDKISICGGFNTTRLANLPTFTEADIREEVRMAIDKYAKYGSFILGNITLFGNENLSRIELVKIATEELISYGAGYYK